MAVSAVALEAAVLVLYGLALVPTLEVERLVMGATSLLFFVVYGIFIGFCGWRLYQLHSWARAPIVLAQLIQLLVGASFWGGSTTPVAVLAVLIAVLVLVGVFHPVSLEAVGSAD